VNAEEILEALDQSAWGEIFRRSSLTWRQSPSPTPKPESRPQKGDVPWTEITKDLVTKEAIEQMGYDYKETENFFYVMENLKYVSSCNIWVRLHVAKLTIIVYRRTCYTLLISRAQLSLVHLTPYIL
jgi:hypothetical protein